MGIFARIKKAWYDSIIWETIDEDFYDELEESLIMADLGAAVAADAVKELRKVVYEKSIQRGDDVKQALRDILEKKLEVGDTSLDLSTTPSVVLIIGVIIGSISGYAGGKVDLILMRIVDIIYSLPDMLVIILLATVLNQVLVFKSGSALAALGSNMVSMFIVFGLLYWVGMARLIRGQILSIKENEYVLAARSIGAKPGWIIRKHILPNCLSVIIVSTALQIPSAIFTESYLSFIGLGVNAPMPSLGSLANSARQGLQTYPYKLIFPALMICLIVLSLNLLGDGLRDAFDPKLKR